MLPTHARAGLARATPLLVLAETTSRPLARPRRWRSPTSTYSGIGARFITPAGTHSRLSRRGFAAILQTPLLVALTSRGAALHSGGPCRRRPRTQPWLGTSERAVYDHVRGRWRPPKRWIQYDGAPADVGLTVLAGAPLFVVLDGPFRWVVAAALLTGATTGSCVGDWQPWPRSCSCTFPSGARTFGPLPAVTLGCRDAFAISLLLSSLPSHRASATPRSVATCGSRPQERGRRRVVSSTRAVPTEPRRRPAALDIVDFDGACHCASPVGASVLASAGLFRGVRSGWVVLVIGDGSLKSRSHRGAAAVDYQPRRRTLLDGDFFDVGRPLFQQDAVPAVRTADATELVQFDIALAPGTLVAHCEDVKRRGYL